MPQLPFSLLVLHACLQEKAANGSGVVTTGEVARSGSAEDATVPHGTPEHAVSTGSEQQGTRELPVAVDDPIPATAASSSSSAAAAGGGQSTEPATAATSTDAPEGSAQALPGEESTRPSTTAAGTDTSAAGADAALQSGQAVAPQPAATAAGAAKSADGAADEMAVLREEVQMLRNLTLMLSQERTMASMASLEQQKALIEAQKAQAAEMFAAAAAATAAAEAAAATAKANAAAVAAGVKPEGQDSGSNGVPAPSSSGPAAAGQGDSAVSHAASSNIDSGAPPLSTEHSEGRAAAAVPLSVPAGPGGRRRSSGVLANPSAIADPDLRREAEIAAKKRAEAKARRLGARTADGAPGAYAAVISGRGAQAVHNGPVQRAVDSMSAGGAGALGRRHSHAALGRADQYVLLEVADAKAGGTASRAVHVSGVGADFHAQAEQHSGSLRTASTAARTTAPRKESSAAVAKTAGASDGSASVPVAGDATRRLRRVSGVPPSLESIDESDSEGATSPERQPASDSGARQRRPSELLEHKAARERALAKLRETPTSPLGRRASFHGTRGPAYVARRQSMANFHTLLQQPDSGAPAGARPPPGEPPEENLVTLNGGGSLRLAETEVVRVTGSSARDLRARARTGPTRTPPNAGAAEVLSKRHSMTQYGSHFNFLADDPGTTELSRAESMPEAGPSVVGRQPPVGGAAARAVATQGAMSSTVGAPRGHMRRVSTIHMPRRGVSGGLLQQHGLPHVGQPPPPSEAPPDWLREVDARRAQARAETAAAAAAAVARVGGKPPPRDASSANAPRPTPAAGAHHASQRKLSPIAGAKSPRSATAGAARGGSAVGAAGARPSGTGETSETVSSAKRAVTQAPTTRAATSAAPTSPGNSPISRRRSVAVLINRSPGKPAFKPLKQADAPGSATKADDQAECPRCYKTAASMYKCLECFNPEPLCGPCYKAHHKQIKKTFHHFSVN